MLLRTHLCLEGYISLLMYVFPLQVVMEFPEMFWSNAVNYFGVAQPGGPKDRGRCFVFWNLAFTGRPILTSLISGEAALAAEEASDQELVDAALRTLRTLYGASTVPDPVASVVTRWASEIHTGGTTPVCVLRS